ncbi:Uncharacterised protein [Mycobacteroides abscessus subsp. abscessus]|uniref:hypothetical protein n=1 Tax=Mycobacteroides abscessus TaxID=36809 RepID=UPI000927226F|nr:hypothetical protein [Mycobacteroides abscessus]SHU29873.1 Uncharacterised protein [Mycobacteroides abscessus subsp. abscessus]
MTTPADIKRLMERKQARLTAFVEIEDKLTANDREFARLQEEHRRERSKLIEQQRTAYEGLVSAGFSAAELQEAGITRRRRMYGSAPATEKGGQKSRLPAEPATYDGDTMSPQTESSA